MQIDTHDRNNFTILRLTLALLVVLGHFHILAGVRAPPWPFNHAATAVDCFFVVSGYLVTYSFDRDGDFRRFYIRRFFRIYPLYIFMVITQTAIMAVLTPSGAAANAAELVRYFMVNAVFANFLQHDVGGTFAGMADPSLNASLWTLKIEVGFYMILPALWLMVRRFGVGVLVGIFFLSIAYERILEARGQIELAKQLPGQLQFFVLGIAAYKYRAVLARAAAHPGTGILVTVIAGVLMTLLLRSQPAGIYPLAVAAFVMTAAFKAPYIPLRSDLSYGVYLVHAPLIQLSLLFGLYRSTWDGLLALLAATILLAFLLERAIERPGIAIGRRLSKRPQPTPATSSTPAPHLQDAPKA